MNKAGFRCLLGFLVVLVFPQLVDAQAEPAPGLVAVRDILDRGCVACHEMTRTREGLMDAYWVVPGEPDKSPLYTRVIDNSMPPGRPLLDVEKSAIREWIADEAPIEAAGTPPSGEPAPSGKYLGFSSKMRYHQVSGFTSASLLLAAGAVGAVQWGTLISEAHDYRDKLGIDDDEMSSECAAYITDLWNDPMHQSLRWTHVGLLVTGNALYVGNAVTGVSMLTKDRPGLSPQDIHRYSFFVHATLMAAEIVLGVLTTDVLSRGSHEEMIALGAAHTAIGVAIPAVMIGSGVLINRAMR